jgi:hypothetical protein
LGIRGKTIAQQEEIEEHRFLEELLGLSLKVRI